MVVEGTPTVRPDPTLGPDSVATPDGGPILLVVDALARGWVTLAAADRVTVTLPRTGREIGFFGPGLIDPCVGTDEAWVVRGEFHGSRGSGESPGAEEWVVTPFGVVRYGAAILEVVVDDASVHASLKGGTATILAEGASTWELLETDASTQVVKGAPLGKAGTAASDERCAKASAAAKSLEDALVLPDAAASPGFGDLAMRANDAHVLMRAACAIAKLRDDPASNSLTRWSPSR
jgi:hypothetical protein